MRRRMEVFALALAGVTAGAACGVSDVIVLVGGEADTLSVTIVDQNAVVVETLFMQVGDTAVLAATALNGIGQPLGNVTPNWSSSNSVVASVTSSGTVLARSIGTTDITAFYDDLIATVPTSVSGAPPPPGPQPNQAPSALIASPAGNVTISRGDPVNFQGAASDSDGAVVVHDWDFGDGSGDDVEDPGEYTYSANGVYDVTYQVTDDDGEPSAVAQRRVTVVDSAGPPGSTPPPGQVYFHTDWDVRGNSIAAITDATKARPWTDVWGNGAVSPDTTVFEVLSTAGEGLDFPTENFLRLTALNQTTSGQDGWAFLVFTAADNYIPPLQVGDSVFYRWYYRVLYNAELTALDDGLHGDEPLEFPEPYAIGQYLSRDRWAMNMYDPGVMTNFSHAGPGEYPLAKYATYRIEHGIIRTGTNTFALRVRIYDAAGNPVVTSGDFNSSRWDGRRDNTFLTNEFQGDSNDWNRYARQFRIGLNGITGMQDFHGPSEVFEWAAFAVCSSWCGAYPIDGVEN